MNIYGPALVKTVRFYNLDKSTVIQNFTLLQILILGEGTKILKRISLDCANPNLKNFVLNYLQHSPKSNE